MHERPPPRDQPGRGALMWKAGGDVLSHRVTPAVPSALWGLTSVFGMGTGMTPTLQPPTIVGSRVRAGARWPWPRSIFRVPTSREKRERTGRSARGCPGMQSSRGGSARQDLQGPRPPCPTQVVYLRIRRTGAASAGQASRGISTARLHVSPRFHLPPINVVVSYVPSGVLYGPGSVHLGVGFPLRCFQRLSRPDVATRQCPWRDNRYTSGQSVPVLSY
jgi:hypothetical protein